jgi:hypothetical protein
MLEFAASNSEEYAPTGTSEEDDDLFTGIRVVWNCITSTSS